VGELAAAERVRPASATTMTGRLEEVRARRESWLATRLARLEPGQMAEVERVVALLEFLLGDEL
jgi:hypothetical protein